MKRIISFCSVILIIAGLLSCASSAPAAGEGSGKTGGSPVYKITKNGNVLYLGGSIHVLRDTDFPLPEGFDYAFSMSDVLVLEADVDLMNTQEVQEYLLYSSLFLDGRSLRTVLSPQTYEMLSLACDKYGFPMDDTVQMIKPSMVVNILTVLQILELGFAETGVDQYYYEKAKDENKTIAFLESVESQIDLMVSMGEGYEDDYVQYSLQDMENTEEDIETMVYEWKNGIISGAEESLAEMIDEWPMLYKSMITDRHDQWFPQIDQFLASGKTHFIIVGFLHLPGPYGLLQYLESKGCTVEPVS